jgi:hypothetical protein
LIIRNKTHPQRIVRHVHSQHESLSGASVAFAVRKRLVRAVVGDSALERGRVEVGHLLDPAEERGHACVHAGTVGHRAAVSPARETVHLPKRRAVCELGLVYQRATGVTLAGVGASGERRGAHHAVANLGAQDAGLPADFLREDWHLRLLEPVVAACALHVAPPGDCGAFAAENVHFREAHGRDVLVEISRHGQLEQRRVVAVADALVVLRMHCHALHRPRLQRPLRVVLMMTTEIDTVASWVGASLYTVSRSQHPIRRDELSPA